MNFNRKELFRSNFQADASPALSTMNRFAHHHPRASANPNAIPCRKSFPDNALHLLSFRAQAREIAKAVRKTRSRANETTDSGACTSAHRETRRRRQGSQPERVAPPRSMLRTRGRRQKSPRGLTGPISCPTACRKIVFASEIAIIC